MNTITNFGGNIRFTPTHFYSPRTDAEVLEILDRHKDGHIRVVASKHAWSEAIVCDDVIIDMQHFADVVVDSDEQGQPWATVGAGCQVKTLLQQLQMQQLTTPSVGLITEQTIAGAIATGTHGSGKHSLSHYIEEMHIAAYDVETGAAKVFVINEGPELRAARCSLGCMGVVLRVRFRPVPQYFVKENATWGATVADMLALEERSPLQQFFLIPHLRKFIAQERSVPERAKRSRLAWLYRCYWFLVIDIAFHLGIKFVASLLRNRTAIRMYYRGAFPVCVLPERVKVIDRSDCMLVMEHELFRHLEIEIFVAKSQVGPAVEFVDEIIHVFAGTLEDMSESWQNKLNEIGMLDELRQRRGSFVHHYPICVRRVLADDTLISMASDDDEPWYAISFITFVRPYDAFLEMAQFLARSMAKLFSARPHWGKYFPLTVGETQALYRHLEIFRDICARYDPHGVFQNDYVKRVLGLAAVPQDINSPDE